MTKEYKKRTPLQNRSEHLYFDKLAIKLNDSGQDVNLTLEKMSIDVPWTKQSVKDLLFKPIMKAMFDVDSTAKLTTKQTSDVYEVLNRHTATILGISVEWPNDEPPMFGRE